MVTVFYDGKCGLCSREISHYRNIAPEGVFAWVDITSCTDELEKAGISYVDALKRLHVQDNEGNIYIGVNAFILIWQQLKKWRLLAFIVKIPIIWHIFHIAYLIFAYFRFKRLAHCKIAVDK